MLNPAGSVLSGRKVVAAAATAESLPATTTGILSIAIQAETDNTGVVVVGDSSVVAAQATRKGIALAAGDTISVQVNQATDIWLDVTVSGDGVTYLAEIA